MQRGPETLSSGRHAQGAADFCSGSIMPTLVRLRRCAFFLAIASLLGCGSESAPADPCLTPGATETVRCGACGTLERFCAADGQWVPGACVEPTDACEPGAIEEVACGACGVQTARCTESCEWEATGACSDEGVCMPGSRARDRGSCGAGQVQDVVCNDHCSFEPNGACESNECNSPGMIETVACGSCGTTDRFCSAAGVWEFGEC
ncbi:MAG: hypothetical protein AAF411_31380, partial [Myxococcota bacterium]